MKAITDVQIASAARQTGIIGPGSTNMAVSVTTLRSFLRALGVPIEPRNPNPFEPVAPASLTLNPAGVGAGARMG